MSLLRIDTSQDTPPASSDQSTETIFQDSGLDENGSSIGDDSLSRTCSISSNPKGVDDIEVEHLTQSDDFFTFMGGQFETDIFNKGDVDAAIDNFDLSCGEVLKDCNGNGEVLEETSMEPFGVIWNLAGRKMI